MFLEWTVGSDWVSLCWNEYIICVIVIWFSTKIYVIIVYINLYYCLSWLLLCMHVQYGLVHTHVTLTLNLILHKIIGCWQFDINKMVYDFNGWFNQVNDHLLLRRTFYCSALHHIPIQYNKERLIVCLLVYLNNEYML